MEIKNPFRGIKIIELAGVLAGPAVGMFFAELGAEVIKIENPKTSGDITRQWKSKGEHSEAISAYYRSVNWGKQVFFLDISTENGKKDLFELFHRADILIMNFKAGDAQKFGLDFETLSVKFPKLICGNISGYGKTDARPAFDLVMQAETGFMSMNGTDESGPLKMPVAIIDLMAAHQLKEGLLTALFIREKTGIGMEVNVSLFDSAIASLANQAANFLIDGISPRRMGSLHPNIAPYGETFLCADSRFIVLAIGTEKQFSQFCTVIGKPELIADPKFSNNASRLINRANLQEIISPFFIKRISSDATEILTRGEVPFSIIKSVDEILQSEGISRLLIDGKVVKTVVFNIENKKSTGL